MRNHKPRPTIDGRPLPVRPRHTDRCTYCGATESTGVDLVYLGDFQWLCQECGGA